MKKSEFQLIECLKNKIPRKLQGDIGIGDDTGVFLDHFLFTTDIVADGVDFISSKIKPELAGRKALAVNLSDIAAMGGKPLAFVVALGVPKTFSQKWIERFYKGMAKFALQQRVACVGGDISTAKEFFASIAIVGKGKKIVKRDGAAAGDWIGVTGKLGGSILGKHASFEPRINEGQALAKAGVSAMIDISDGLLQDLGHILKSSGKGAVLEITDIPVSPAAWKLSGKTRGFESALTGGEDFELLFTASDRVKKKINTGWNKKFPGQPLYWIGRITPQKEMISWQLCGKKVKAPEFKNRGYAHF